jgi:hypothetical protein
LTTKNYSIQVQGRTPFRVAVPNDEHPRRLHTEAETDAAVVVPFPAAPTAAGNRGDWQERDTFNLNRIAENTARCHCFFHALKQGLWIHAAPLR